MTDPDQWPEDLDERNRPSAVGMVSADRGNRAAEPADPAPAIGRYQRAREHFEATGDADSLAEGVEEALRLSGTAEGAPAVQWAARRLLESERRGAALRAATALTQTVETVTGPDRVALRIDLVTALRHHAKETGDAPDIQAALIAAHDTVELATDTDRTIALGSLGSTQLVWYGRTGVLAHLDEAIRTLRRADAAAEGRNENALANLSIALLSRYRHVHDLADLAEAIDVSRRAAAIAADDHGQRPAFEMNVAQALWLRYERTGQMSDLEEAIRLQRAAVAAARPGSELAASAEANLGILHRARFRRRRHPTDLQESVSRARTALAMFQARPGGSVRAGVEMIDLAVALADRYSYLGDDDSLDEAIDLAVRAVPLLDGAEHGRRWTTGTMLADRYRRDKRPDDARAAIGHLSDAAHSTTASAGLRLEAAKLWCELARETDDQAEAARAFTVAVDLHTSMPYLGTSRPTRERALTAARGLASDAVAAALDVGDPDTAVHHLERARSVLWIQRLDLRSDLTAVAAVDPVLAGRIEALGRSLAGELPPPTPPPTTNTLDRLDAVHRQPDVDEAIELARTTVAEAPPGWLSLASGVLRSRLTERFHDRRQRRDIDEAVAAGANAVLAAPAGDTVIHWRGYADALIDRFDAYEEAADLNLALRALRHAAVAEHNPRARADILADLADACERQAFAGDDPAALSEAVRIWREAVSLGSADGDEQWDWETSLAVALARRFPISDDPTDLDEAIDRLTAVNRHFRDEDTGVRNTVLAGLLHTRWEIRGHPSDLGAAQAAARAGVAGSGHLNEQMRQAAADMLTLVTRGTADR
ncbi:hypothetical protein [Actinoplanes sp. NPDC049802]|uniref:hypothetical protein n=1 Tax=Actinoplanes sp. NPDC049802 TaxID=3154742 RepID=UPI0033F9EFAD